MKRLLFILFFAVVGLSTSVDAREKRPVIGISASKPSSATVTYVNAVRAVGGVPVIIPITTDGAELDAILKRVDGIILTGGEDILPKRYGEESLPELGEVYLERDDFDIMLTQKAVEKRLPVFGICRGLQVMNVAFGGTLYQDIPSQLPQSKVKHKTSDIQSHKISIKEGTLLQELLGDETTVNTIHHQSVKDLAPGFVISATSEDGVVEGIESKKMKCVFGVQFHPEMLVREGYDKFLALFDYLIKCAR